MRKRQQSLYVINSSQLKVETTCSSRSSSPLQRDVELPVCPKGAFLKGVSPCWSATVGNPSLLPQAGFQLPHLLSSWSNPGILQYFLKEAVKSCCSAVSNDFINVLLWFLQTSCGLVKLSDKPDHPSPGSCLQLSGLEGACPSPFPRRCQGCH